jgi:hypothetical protein
MPCHAMPCHATVLRTGFQDRCEARDAGGFQRQLAALSNQATRPLWLLQGPLCELMCVLPLPARTQGSAPCPTSRRASNTDYISLTHKHMPKHTTKIARRAHLGVQGSTLFLNGFASKMGACNAPACEAQPEHIADQWQMAMEDKDWQELMQLVLNREQVTHTHPPLSIHINYPSTHP